MSVDTSQIAQLDVEPGELPPTMAAWVIRAEREGEPTEAFQLEEMEVPEPGAFEVTVRVMAAGVNFNNVWAALGKPVSVFRYHAEDHHIGGSDASGVVWKVGEGVTRWKPGDEVVVHCNQASYEDPEVHGLDPLAAPSQQIWGYETTWGSFAQFCKVQAQQLLPKPKHLSWEEAASYGLTYFTAYRMLMDQAELQPGHRVLVWGAAGGLGVFALQLGKLAICGATSGYTLDFDVRYLWMRQKQIIGSHFANAWECLKANELIEQGKIRPVLWRTLPFDGVAEAHQLLRDNKHLGKIAILVGAEAEGQGRTAEGPGAIRAEVGA